MAFWNLRVVPLKYSPDPNVPSENVAFTDPDTHQEHIQPLRKFGPEELFTVRHEYTKASVGAYEPPEYSIYHETEGASFDWSGVTCRGKLFSGAFISLSGQDAHNAANFKCGACHAFINTVTQCLAQLAAFLATCVRTASGAAVGAALHCANSLSASFTHTKHDDSSLNVLFLSNDGTGRSPMAAALYKTLLNPPFAQVVRKDDGRDVVVNTQSAGTQPTDQRLSNSVFRAVDHIMSNSKGMRKVRCKAEFNRDDRAVQNALDGEVANAGEPPALSRELKYCDVDRMTTLYSQAATFYQRFVYGDGGLSWDHDVSPRNPSRSLWYPGTICDLNAQLICRSVVGRRYDVAKRLFENLDPATSFNQRINVGGGGGDWAFRGDWVFKLQGGNTVQGAAANLIQNLRHWADDATFQTGIMQIKFTEDAPHTFALEKKSPGFLRLWQG